ncbi:hypothetical protein P8605_45430 [Streptomyces sp. T-3]|nr:hypothetical protein [Streptomyces sp. T-3]
MLGGAGILLAAAPAQAAESSWKTECVPSMGSDPVQGTTKADITAPAEAKVGDEVEVVWKFVQAASKNPDIIDLPKDSLLPTGTVKTSGAQTADIKLEGPRQNPAIPKGGDMKLADMKGKIKLTTAGDVTLTPDVYNINAQVMGMSVDTKCSPKEAVPKAVTIKVTGGGGSSGGSDSGGAAAGGSDSGGSAAGGSDSGGSDSGGSTGGGGGQTDFVGKEVQVPYKCVTPIGDKEATSPVQINAKKSGGNYDLTVKFKKSVMDSPADIPKDSVKPSMSVDLGGADKGTVQVEGPTNAEPIKSGDPIKVPDLTGTYKPGASGKSTLSPGVLIVKALGTTTTCTPETNLVSLELDTAAVPGGAAGGSASGSAGGSDGGSADGGAASGGGLAETGADDNGALRALGLVAGTVILLGGAVFTFMPRRRTH